MLPRIESLGALPTKIFVQLCSHALYRKAPTECIRMLPRSV